jgi:hypothetical protein
MGCKLLSWCRAWGSALFNNIFLTFWHGLKGCPYTPQYGTNSFTLSLSARCPAFALVKKISAKKSALTRLQIRKFKVFIYVTFSSPVAAPLGRFLLSLSFFLLITLIPCFSAGFARTILEQNKRPDLKVLMCEIGAQDGSGLGVHQKNSIKCV